jgi:hypothetical protein
MECRVFEIPENKLYEESLKICIGICGIQIDTLRGEKILNKCIATREAFCKDCIIKVIVRPFVHDLINESALKIKDKVIYCNKFKELDLSKVIGGYMYAITVEPLSFELMSTLQMFYADCWLNAYVETAWHGIKLLLTCELIKDFKIDENKIQLFLSECYGPGFNGMELKSVSDIFELMNLSKFGIKLHEEYMLMPYHSIVGICLVNT